MMVSCNEMNSTAPPKNKLPTQTWRCYTEYNTIEIREVDARYREGDTIFANPNSRHSYKVVLKENVTK
jgi:hypothetical protein